MFHFNNNLIRKNPFKERGEEKIMNDDNVRYRANNNHKKKIFFSYDFSIKLALFESKNVSKVLIIEQKPDISLRFKKKYKKKFSSYLFHTN